MSTASQRPKSVYGRKSAVVSGHHLATLTAKSILDQGGSLIDAMVASSAVLTVVLPHATSLASCAMMLYYDAKTAQIYALNGSGRAPYVADLSLFKEGMPQRGSRASVTPALVRHWAQAHKRFGKLAWKSLFDSAIDYAVQGIGCAEELAKNLHLAKESVSSQPGFSSLFMRQGHLLRAGDLLKQPELARVLETIACEGEEGFYSGWVAESLLQFMQQNNGLINKEDLLKASADWVESRHMNYSGHRIDVMPPNSIGSLMLEQLKYSETRESALSYAKKLEYDILAAIEAIKNADIPAVGPFQDRGDTAGFAAIDEQGNAISMLQSVFQPFGSGCVDTNTGILFNNRMFDFSIKKKDSNCLAPGYRPRHTLNPYLISNQTGISGAGNSPGGISQITTGFQIISGILDADTPLGKIVSRPRWSITRDLGILFEPGLPSETAEALREKGFDVIENSQHEFYFGSAKVIRKNSDTVLEAAADDRRQAYAMAW